MSVLLYRRSFPWGSVQTWDGPPSWKTSCQVVAQCHGHTIVPAERAGSAVAADGLLSPWPSPRPLAVRTADCLPILVKGERGIALLHAGHKGVREAIHLRPELADLRPRTILVGPHIRSCCFEVGQDFPSLFPGSRHFLYRQGKIFFDLQAEVQAGMRGTFPGIGFLSCHLCTCCDGRFHSHRRDGTEMRNWTIFVSPFCQG